MMCIPLLYIIYAGVASDPPPSAPRITGLAGAVLHCWVVLFFLSVQMEAPASPTPDTMRPEVAVRHVVWSILMEKEFGIEGIACSASFCWVRGQIDV